MSDDIDRDALADEAVELFKGLLQIDTTNPPGHERRAAEYLEHHLRDEGYDPWMAEAGDRRANLVARLPATVDEPDEPLLLAGHTDVVPADADAWRHPPFEAVEDDGCIWGRGAVDMKNMVATSATVMRAMARADGERRRDLIFAAVADEEAGCEHGSKFLVEEHPERVQAGCMIGEVGGFWQHVEGEVYIPVMVAEKGRAHLRLTVEGPSGHGSIPRSDTVVASLGRILERLSTERLPHHLTEPTERFVRTMAETQSLVSGLGLKGLLSAKTADIVLDRLLPDPEIARNFDALLHNTVSPTIVEAGETLNVIPSTAGCELDGRLLPGYSGDDLKREVEALLDDVSNVDIEVLSEQPAVETDPEAGEAMGAIREVVETHAPQAHPVPYMIPGYTDAQYFHRLGMQCFGFSPIRIPADRDLVFSELFHGVDERIPIDGFRWGVQVLFDLVRRLVEP